MNQTPPKALREMGADFTYAADALSDTMRHLEQGRNARLESQTTEDLLRQALESVQEAAKSPMPVWHCPACKIEIELGETFGHCAQCGKPLEPNPRDAAIPEPYRAGLPLERLRKVCVVLEAKPPVPVPLPPQCDAERHCKNQESCVVGDHKCCAACHQACLTSEESE